MPDPTLEELTVLARVRAVHLPAARLARILPEVQRLWEQAGRLREVPLAAEEPATRLSFE